MIFCNTNCPLCREVYLETEKEFTEKKNEAPETLLSKELKEGLLSSYEVNVRKEQQLILSRTEDEYHVPGLPFSAGNGWRYNQQPHGCGELKCALDFGTPGGNYSVMVKAAEDGEVTAVGDTCLKVRRYDSSFELLYQHIEPTDIDNWQNGDLLELGDSIGMTTTTSGTGMCDGSSSGHHVHIQMHNISLEGKSFNGWVIDGNNLVKEGITRYPNSSFDAPTILHDNWVVAKGSDYIISFPGKAHIPRSILVKNDSVLKLGNESKLWIDKDNYKLEIQPSSGIEILNGGGIKLE